MALDARPTTSVALDGLRDQLARYLPWLALFVRVTVGLGLVIAGVIVLIGTGLQPGGGFGSPGPGLTDGLQAILGLLPYLALATGLGLVLGVFTTLASLVACGLVLLVPLLICVNLLANAPMGMGGQMFRRFGPGYEMVMLSLLCIMASTPMLVLTVLLAPASINRFSIDALIFRRASLFVPTGPDPGVPAEGDRPREEDQFASV